MITKDELIILLDTDIEKFNDILKNTDEQTDLSEVDFSGKNIERAEFINVDLTSSTFADSHLSEVKFDNCDLTSVDFTRCNLVECNFSDSILNGTDFSYSTVNYCNFTDTDMAGSIFQASDLSNSDLTMTENLSASRFDEETIWPDNDCLPEDFDTSCTKDLSALQEDDDYVESDY